MTDYGPCDRCGEPVLLAPRVAPCKGCPGDRDCRDGVHTFPRDLVVVPHRGHPACVTIRPRPGRPATPTWRPVKDVGAAWRRACDLARERLRQPGFFPAP